MNKILNKLNAVPGVVGSMICNEEGEVLAHLFPQEYETGMLNSAAGIISDHVAAFSDPTGGIKMFDLRFSKGRLLIRSVNNLYFLILCSSQTVVNLGLLEMTLSVAAKHLEKTAEPVAEAAPARPVAVAPAAAGPKPSPADLLSKGPLSATLTGMQGALAKFLGPMAKIIFMECVEKWVDENYPSKETLPQLISIIDREIDDPAKSAQYAQMIAQYM